MHSKPWACYQAPPYTWCVFGMSRHLFQNSQGRGDQALLLLVKYGFSKVLKVSSSDTGGALGCQMALKSQCF